MVVRSPAEAEKVLQSATEQIVGLAQELLKHGALEALLQGAPPEPPRSTIRKCLQLVVSGHVRGKAFSPEVRKLVVELMPFLNYASLYAEKTDIPPESILSQDTRDALELLFLEQTSARFGFGKE